MLTTKRFQKLLLSFVTIGLLLLFIVCPANADFLPNVETMIFNLTNQERVAEGLPQLTRYSLLNNMARQHSQEMAELGYFDHDSPNPQYESLIDRANQAGITNYTVVAENIGRLTDTYGQYSEQDMAIALVDGWMNSEGHRENILDAEYTHIGVGVYELNGRFYFTQNFAAFNSPPPSSGDGTSNGTSGSILNYPYTGFPFSGLFSNILNLAFPSSYYGSPFGQTLGGMSGMNTYLYGMPFGGGFSLFGNSISPYSFSFGGGFPVSGANIYGSSFSPIGYGFGGSPFSNFYGASYLPLSSSYSPYTGMALVNFLPFGSSYSPYTGMALGVNFSPYSNLYIIR